MTLISRHGFGLSKTTVLWLCSSVLWTACKKPPETAVPVQIQTTVEQPSEEGAENSDQAESESNTSTDSDAQSESPEAQLDEENIEQTEDASFEFADSVNNAVALLTGDDVAVQKGLGALEALAKSSDSEAPEIAYNIGVAHLKLGNERAAKKSFEEAVELDPTFAKGWYNMGVLLERNRQYDEAIALYEEGLLHSETDPTLSAGKISCLRKSGRLDESIAYAQQVLSKNANNVDAYSEVGMVLLEQGNLEKALFVLQQASAKNGSENAKLQSVLGQVYYAQEKIPLAERAFTKSLALDPTLIETSMYLSFLQLENRAWTKASDTLEAALKLEPTNAALLNAMGIAQRGLGNIEEAERLYKEAYQLNPSNPEPLLNLAVLEADYKEGNNYAKAYNLLDRYLDEGGTKSEIVQQWRSEIEASEAVYLEQKKKEELRALFKRRREDAARKRAEEEAKRVAEEEAEKEAQQNVEDGDGSNDDESNDAESDESEGAVEEASEESIENSENETAAEDDSDTEAEDSEDEQSEDASETDSVNEESQVEAEEESTETEVEQPGLEDNGWGAPTETNTDEEPPEKTADPESNDESGDASDGEAGGTENDGDADGGELEGATEVEDNNAASSSADDNTSEKVENIEAFEDVDEEDEESDDSSVNDQMEETGNGWGIAEPNPACEVQEDCPSDLVCASNKECLSEGEFGTLQEGDACTTTDECAVSLDCIEQVCSTESVESDEQ